MTSRRILCVILTFVLIAALGGQARSDAKLNAIGTLFGGLGSGHIDRAVRTFSPALKAQLSGEQLVDAWNRLYGDEGKLVAWKIIGRAKTGGLNPGTSSAAGDIELFTVELRFTKSFAIAVVGLSSDGQIVGMLPFQPPHSTPVSDTAPYADRTKFRAVAVTVPGPRGPLPGTLTIPDGSGPFSAAVLVAGAGVSDRDESSLANRPFKDIAEGLSSKGIVVLRYDKRTFAAPKTLDMMSVTVDNEVIDDAVAAVTTLRSRPAVRADRIYVVGHSLGAMLAPEVAKRAAPIAGIVLLAPAGRKVPQLIADQARSLGQASPEQIVEVERQANQLMAGKMPPHQIWLGAPASYYVDLDARDEIAIARSLGVPILILHGSHDYHVIDKDIEAWQRGLKGVDRVTIIEIPKLNHFFIPIEGKPTSLENLTPGHVDPAVIGAITNFVEAR